MSHIPLPPELPGIRGLLAYRPETARPLNQLVDVLLRGPHTLSRGERELIATYVSSRNDCAYCQAFHGAMAAHELQGGDEIVAEVKRDFQHSSISDKLKALLVIAGKTSQSGKYVTKADVDCAREHGATDLEIHDTVLIAALFCLFNRYVDGLDTEMPEDPDVFRQRAAIVAEVGYAAATRPEGSHAD